ncbi:MAG TPA: class I SAM-dependent methyltransferase [Thermoplasmata archaeon]|nr:class I SAM-dependent methyltransferase [Thermoplasmata archaeon]
MAEQYFARQPASSQRPLEFHVTVRGHVFTFRTDAGVFSGKKLDRGSELLIEALEVQRGESVLDLGCGYGAIGVVAARLSEGGRVIMTDVNARAVALARANLTLNKVTNAEVRLGNLYDPVPGFGFHHIACNPPIRAGRAVVDRIITEAPSHLRSGGSLWLVARTRQGADSIRSRMTKALGNATIVKRGSGYKVLQSVATEA